MERPHPPFEGTCLCGSVTVRITAPPLLTMACHCKDCQKLSASAYTLTVMFPARSFSCDGDLMTGGLGSEGRTHYFCKSCLTFMYSQVAGAESRINLRVSVLDNADAFSPFIEVMTDDKLPWVHVPAVHSFARLPGSIDEFNALLAAYAAK